MSELYQAPGDVSPFWAHRLEEATAHPLDLGDEFDATASIVAGLIYYACTRRREGTVSVPFRRLSELSGASIGKTSWTIRRLVELGHLEDDREARRYRWLSDPFGLNPKGGSAYKRIDKHRGTSLFCTPGGSQSFVTVSETPTAQEDIR